MTGAFKVLYNAKESSGELSCDLYFNVSDWLIGELHKFQKVRARLGAIKWVFELEKQRNPTLATFLLDKTASYIRNIWGRDGDIGSNALRDELLTSLLRCKVMASLQLLLPPHHPDLNLLSRFQDSISTPDVMVRMVLEESCQMAWNFQLTELEKTSAAISCYELQRTPLLPPVVKYLSTVATLLSELGDHYALFGNCQLLSMNPESARKELLLRLVTVPTGSLQFTQRASDWGQEDAPAELAPGPAEFRRRMNLYSSFSIAALMCSCKDANSRYTIFEPY